MAARAVHVADISPPTPPRYAARVANLRQLRQSNEHRILAAMLRLGTATRGDLTRETRMSQPTVGRIVESLLQNHTLTEVDPGDAAAGLGRPSRRLGLNRQTPRFLGIQLGVRRTRLALLPTAPPPVDAWQAEFPTGGSEPGWKKSFARACGQLDLAGLDGAVLGVPGVVDEQFARALFSPNLRWIEQLELVSIRPLIGKLPLLIGQEIRLLARGHSVIYPDQRNFLLVDLGSGVGAAVVRDGQVMASSLPLSGELGHAPVLGNPRRCSCGAVGCVETVVSRAGLLASARENRWPDHWPALVERVHAKGLPPWLRQALDALATTIAGALNLVGLDHVVVTGALREFPPAVGEYLHQQTERGAMWRRFGPVSLSMEPRHRAAGMTAYAIDRLLMTR
jgi:predicted NBD/HSP70 family sugar kinase